MRAIDVEDDKQPKIIDYFGLKINDETLEIEGELEQLIYPGEQVTEEITGITGITNDMLQGMPQFAQFLPKLQEFHLGQRSFVGHNISFDVDMLHFELRRLDMVRHFPWPPKHICTVEESEHYEGRRLKLSDLHLKLTGNVLEGAHRAKPDVMGTYRCILAMRDRGDWNPS